MVLLGLFNGNAVLKCSAVDFSDEKSIWRTFGECIFFKKKWPMLWRMIKIAENL